MIEKREVVFNSSTPANVLQCSICGQIIASSNPENLRRVCLACCPRIKENDPETPYYSFSESFPVKVLHCQDREGTKGGCK